jgi:hypothetical protein
MRYEPGDSSPHDLGGEEQEERQVGRLFHNFLNPLARIAYGNIDFIL